MKLVSNREKRRSAMLNQAKIPMLTREGNVVYIEPRKDFEAVSRMNEVLVNGISKFIERGCSGHSKHYFQELLERARSGGNHG